MNGTPVATPDGAEDGLVGSSELGWEWRLERVHGRAVRRTASVDAR
jgi:hypothetical protein